MRGHGKLLRGLTPAQLVDEVLQRRIERMATEPERLRWYGDHPDYAAQDVHRLQLELARTRWTLRMALVAVIVEGLALLVTAGVRLLGL